MTVFMTGHGQVNPSAKPQGASNAVAQQVYRMMIHIMIAQMAGMEGLYKQVVVAGEYQQGTASILAILNGSKNPVDWDLFGKFYPWLLNQMNNPDVPKGLRSFLKSLLGKPYWRKLFDKLHKDVYNLQLAENGHNKALVKKYKKAITADIVAIRKGNDVVAPPHYKGTPAEWKKIHAQWLEEHDTAKNVAADTKATAMVLYERAMNVVNTVIGMARYASAMMKQNQNVITNIENNAGS